MSKNKLSVFCFIIGITTISISYLSAADCVDDVTGAYTGIGQSCDTVINSFGTDCPVPSCPVLSCPVFFCG